MTEVEKELQEKHEKLRDRVEKLERYLWVVVSVLTVFGVSEAFGARWLNSVSDRLTHLSAQY